MKKKEKEKESCNAGDPGLIPALGRYPGEGNDYPHLIFGWRIQWKDEAGGYSPWSCRNGHDWATNAFSSKLFLVIFKLLVFILIITGDKQRKCFLIAYYVPGWVLRVFPTLLI